MRVFRPAPRGKAAPAKAPARGAARAATRTPVTRAGTVSAKRPLWVDSLPTHHQFESLEQAMRRSLELAHQHAAPAAARTELATRLKRLEELRAWCHGLTQADEHLIIAAGKGMAHRVRRPLGGANRGLESLAR